MADLKKRLWKFVFYPESAPENWRDVIEDWGLPVLVSPLHNLDVKEDGTGELKKEHFHGLMAFDGPTAYSVALGLASQLGCTIVKECRSRRRDERYFCHLDSPNKAFYDVADLQCFGGYEVRYLEDEYEFDGITAIHDIAEDLGIVNYADLSNEVVTNHRELISCLLRYTSHFSNFCYARTQLVRAGDNTSYVKSRRKVGR